MSSPTVSVDATATPSSATTSAVPAEHSALVPAKGKIVIAITENKLEQAPPPPHYVYTIVTTNVEDDGKTEIAGKKWTTSKRYSECLALYEKIKAKGVDLKEEFPQKKLLFFLATKERQEKIPVCLMEMATLCPDDEDLTSFLEVPAAPKAASSGEAAATPITPPIPSPATNGRNAAPVDDCVKEIKSKGFDDERKAVMKKYADQYYFNVADLLKVIGALNFDDERMEAVRVIGAVTIDVKKKKADVLDALPFDDEKEKASSIIDGLTEFVNSGSAASAAVPSGTSGPATHAASTKGDGEAGKRLLLEEKRRLIKDDDAGMPAKIFDMLKDRMKAASFTDEKFTLLDCALDSNGIAAGQAAELIDLFTFSSDKVKLVDHLVNHLTNPSKKDLFINKYSGGDQTKVKDTLAKQTAPAACYGEAVLVLPHTAIRTEGEMKELLDKINKESFSSNKVSVMKTECASKSIGFTADQTVAILKCYAHSSDMVSVLTVMMKYILGMACAQICDVLKAFTFSKDRLDVLRQIKVLIQDPQNKFTILQGAFTFGSDMKTAEEILRDVQPSIPVPCNVVYGKIDVNEVVFCVDISGSMGASFRTSQGETVTRLQFSVRELKNVLATLPGTAVFNIVAFDSSIRSLFQGLQVVNEDNLKSAFDWLNQLRPNTSTNTLGVLQSAIQYAPSAIYLLSDGVPDQSTSTILAWVKANNPKNIPVNAIAFLMPGRDAKAVAFMKEIAEATKGMYRAVESDK